MPPNPKQVLAPHEFMNFISHNFSVDVCINFILLQTFHVNSLKFGRPTTTGAFFACWSGCTAGGIGGLLGSTG